MDGNRKIVVTMTSWAKRIGNCHRVVSQILSNTMKPDMVFLNLSVAEFPGRDADIPKQLTDMAAADPTFRINWVEGPNTKSMKKVFPVLHMLDGEDIIIDVDDDLDIPQDFIQSRVDEFKRHHCRFPISGGNNPRWHLKRPLHGVTYTSLTPASLFQRKMLDGYERVMCDAVVKTYNDDTVYTMLCISNGYWPMPTSCISTFYGCGPRKIGLRDDVHGMRRNGVWKSDTETVRAFERAFDASSPVPFRKRMFNLVIFDSQSVAGDNGEQFYRVARQRYPWMNMTFVISRDCPDWKRLESDGFNLYPFEGGDLDTLMGNATFILWSKDTSKSDILKRHRDKSVFVSHGTTSTLYDVSFYLGSRISKMAKYVCVNSDEESRVVKEYSRNALTPLALGFPRHDTLLPKARAYASSPGHGKRVLLSFHYRGGQLDGSPSAFRSSQYLKGINMLLNCSAMKSLVDGGVDVVFIPHARCLKYLDCFRIPPYIECGANQPFQDIFAESDILVTDFSSTSFEFAYMDRPTLVYVPDMEYVSRHMRSYHMEHMKDYPHLTVCGSEDELFRRLDALAHGKGCAHGFSHRTFKHVDTDNTMRLVDWMMGMYMPRPSPTRFAPTPKGGVATSPAKDRLKFRYSAFMHG